MTESPVPQGTDLRKRRAGALTQRTRSLMSVQHSIDHDLNTRAPLGVGSKPLLCKAWGAEHPPHSHDTNIGQTVGFYPRSYSPHQRTP